MLNKKKALLATAVANASMVLALETSAATFVVTDSGDDAGNINTLRGAIQAASLNGDNGDIITIDVSAVDTITLDSTIFVDPEEALIIAAEVDDEGAPQVSIEAGEGGFGLFRFEGEGSGSRPVILSGLTLTGASSPDNGGAILAENTALILDKSVVSGNTAVGAGGGVAVDIGELCLQGSKITGNTVTEVDGEGGAYAFGGGAAVNDGNVNVLPSTNDPGDLNCLLPDVEVSPFADLPPEFGEAAAALAGNPDGVDALQSVISGNTAEVDATAYFYGRDFVAAGGGLAILGSRDAQPESTLLDCDAKYDLGCSRIRGASITGNSASLTSNPGEGEEGPIGPEHSIVAGGGVFVGSAPWQRGQSLEVKYTDVSDNQITLAGTGADMNDVVVGAGIGALNSYIPANVSSFWSPGEGECGTSTCGNAVYLRDSTVTGNTATAEQSQGFYDPKYSLDLIAGGGVGVIGVGEGSYAYNRVTSEFSSVSGNTLDTSASEERTAVLGGGVAVGHALPAFDGAPGAELVFGKYYGIYSGNSGNEVLVTGSGNFFGAVGGGGTASSLNIMRGKKPQFAIISDAEPDATDGSTNTEALFTAPGGLTDNLVDVTTGGGFGAGLIAGGGSLNTSKYAINELMGAVIAGNEVNVDAGSSEGFFVAGGGGAAVIPLRSGPAFVATSVKYSRAVDNSVTVTGGADLEVQALGGAIGVIASFSPIDGGPSPFTLRQSEVSGNTITLNTSSVSAEAAGGGVAALNLAKYDGEISASTIANNSLVAPDGPEVLGAGLYLSSLDDFAIRSTTISGNTGSEGGTAVGGQAFLFTKYDSAFSLENTIITGNVEQGDADIYYNNDPDVTATSVFHGADPGLGFIASTFADPAFLGELQFNGSLFGAGEGEEGGIPGFLARTHTIALLPDSPAIDPDDGGCLSSNDGDADQRGYDREDGCGDLGAYEFMAEKDGDTLVDGAELDAAGTDADILASMPGDFPAPFGLVLESGDGNSDGIPDVDQSFVASFTSETAGPLTLYVIDPIIEGTEGAYHHLEAVAPVAGATADGLDLSLGGVGFTVMRDDGEGGSEAITDPVELAIVVPDTGLELSLVKQVCNPAPGEWMVLDDTPEPFGDGRVRFTFTLEEDGPFDCNGDELGIEDPIYIAQAAPPAAPPAPTAAPVGGAQGAPVPVPTLPVMFSMLMTGTMGLIGMLGLRSRRNKAQR